MTTLYDVLSTKDIVADRLRTEKRAKEIETAIEDEETKKARWALGLTLLGGLINPAFAIAGGIAGRHGADILIRSEEERIEAPKYRPSEVADINKELARFHRRSKMQDYTKDLRLAISTLMLGGLSDKIAEMGFGKAITDPETWTTWGGERGIASKLLPSLYKPWEYGGR